jgi:6-phosphogluconolactonase
MTATTDSLPTPSLECWIAQDGIQLADWAYQFLRELLMGRCEHPAYIALSGGTTPKRMYERMTQDPADAAVWQNAHWFVSDERNVPLDHSDSNFGLAERILFQPAAVPKSLQHPVPIQIQAPEQAAEQYATMIAHHLPRRVLNRPSFDLILLGLGDDAHTASLFPGTAALREVHLNVIANYVPKLNTSRITFSAPLINSATEVIFLVSGSSKTTALDQIWYGTPNTDQYPAQLIRSSKRLIWMVDRAALGNLTPPSQAKVVLS